MKSKIFLVVIPMLILLTMITTTKSYGQQCPTGYSSITLPIQAGNCLYDVQICFKCVGTNPYSYLKINGWSLNDPNCTQTISTNEIYQQLCQTIYNYEFLSAFVCQSGTLVPCNPDLAGISVQYSYEVCWQKELKSDGKIHYYPCNLQNTPCYGMFRYCWDPNLNLVITQVGTWLPPRDIDACKDVAEPTDPIDLNLPTSCFQLSTPCYP